MSNDEIRELVGQVFDEKIRGGLTGFTNMEREFSSKKDRLIAENVSEDDPRVQLLQTEIDYLYVASMVLKSLKMI